MSDNGDVAPESRLKAAGFSQRMGFWVTPDGTRVLNLGDAIAGLDSGEIQPGGPTLTLPDTGVRALPDKLLDRICPPPPPPVKPEPPPWLLAQAEVIAEVTAAKLKPLIRAEIRAALKAEARKQAREASK
jgi:hypothetical protein